MAQSATISWAERTAVQTATIPWYVWMCALAVTSASVGGVWDISWHESIGRDTFWTAPHLLIQLGGILAGVAALYLIMSTTFGKADRSGAVKIWGFYGPLGAFICCWGGVAMVTSAPFDNWWHSAYGLDVKILSPPHMVLIMGMLVIRFGAVLLVLGELSRAQGVLRGKLHAMLLYLFVFILGVGVGLFQEYTFTDYMHSGMFYLLMCLLPPLFLMAISRVSEFRWPCTAVTGMLATLNLIFLWILPLFPAEPKLGPVYQHVTHMIPPPFPLLLIVPAFALDLLRPKMEQWNLWKTAGVSGAVFLAVFVAAQWPFADFLMSPASRNWVFGTENFPFFVPSDDEWVRHVFTQVETSAAQFWGRMGLALVFAMLTSRAGLSLGNWMRKVRR